jgi:hypothetical protein
MRESSILYIVAFLSFVALASVAYGGCPSCKEGNWQESADAFLNDRPINDEPIVFTAKAAREQSSQFENDAQGAAGNGSNDNDPRRIALQSINATPATVNSTGTTKITAVFAVNGSDGQDLGDIQLSANAVVRDSAGSEVAKLILIKQSANQYFSDWVADVLPGIYSVDISAYSQEGAGSFKDALNIEVIDGGASGTPAP